MHPKVGMLPIYPNFSGGLRKLKNAATPAQFTASPQSGTKGTAASAPKGGRLVAQLRCRRLQRRSFQR